MIVRRDEVPEEHGISGGLKQLQYSDAGGLTQYGAYVETLDPGAKSSERHWHEEEDEFLYVLSGEATVIEDDGEHVLLRGDAACWKAGTANAHHVRNLSDGPCSYLIFGTRVKHDVVHYPDSGRTLYDFEDGTWRLEDADGKTLREGKK